jgi:hypothetical protein
MNERCVAVRDMPYSSDLTDEQWDLLEPVFMPPGNGDVRHEPARRGTVPVFSPGST